MGGIRCTRYLFAGTFSAISSVGGTFSAVSSVGGTFWAASSWRYSFGDIESWRYFSAVSRVGGTFFTEAVKPKYGFFSVVMQYDGNVLAVGGSLFLAGNASAVGGITKIWRNRHITGTAHQGGNFTAGKIPTTTLQTIERECTQIFCQVPRAGICGENVSPPTRALKKGQQ